MPILHPNPWGARWGWINASGVDHRLDVREAPSTLGDALQEIPPGFFLIQLLLITPTRHLPSILDGLIALSKDFCHFLAPS